MKNWMKVMRGNAPATKHGLAADMSGKAQEARPLIALQLAHQAHWETEVSKGYRAPDISQMPLLIAAFA